MSAAKVTYGAGTVDDPWILKTPSLTSDYKAWRDDTLKPPALVVQVGPRCCRIASNASTTWQRC